MQHQTSKPLPFPAQPIVPTLKRRIRQAGPDEAEVEPTSTQEKKKRGFVPEIMEVD